MKKIAIFFGGPGPESQVSVMSAKEVFANFDCQRYLPLLFYWSPENRQFYLEEDFSNLGRGKRIVIEDFPKYFSLALPLTHGRFGEDGILQAILESQGVVYAGGNVLNSAMCMDKAVFKNFVAANNWRQSRYLVIDQDYLSEEAIISKEEEIKKSFSLPVFVKPANSGSSLGISRVDSWDKLSEALALASSYDRRLLVEEGFVGVREIELALVGRQDLLVSDPGELRASKDFYDYEDKYEKSQAEIMIPAALSDEQKKKFKELAVELYKSFSCRGFARLDFFLFQDEIYINEINTLPGFTKSSMFPRLMMAMGLSFKELINLIIEEAESRS